MFRFILFILVLIFAGCGEVDKDELRKLNHQISKIDKQERISTKKVDKNATKADQKQQLLVSPKPTNTKVVSTNVEDSAYLIAQKKIEKELKLAKISTSSSIELANIELEKRRVEKSKELEIALKTTELNNKIESKKLDLEYEKAKMQKKSKERELEARVTETKFNNNHDLRKSELEIRLEKERMEFYKLVLLGLAILVIIGLIFWYLIDRKRRQTQLKLQEEEIRKEQQMQLLQIQHERVNKMLDIVTNGKELPKNVEKELLHLIKDGSKYVWKIDDDRPKGLIFKG